MSNENDNKALTSQILRSAQTSRLEFVEPLTSEDLFAAQGELGFGAGIVPLLTEARKSKGRRPGARNRRNDDFVRYISQFGRDPAITLMEIQSTMPEELVARSRLLDTAKRQMTMLEAQSLRKQCAEALMPYFHSKMPLSVDLGEAGDFNLLIPGTNISAEDAVLAAGGQFVLEADFEEVDEGEAGGD